MTDFSNRTVLITGAAGGIGQALCRYFGAQGAAIAALDQKDTVLSWAEELNKTGVRAAAAVADIGAVDQVEAAVEQLRAELGPMTIIINNAGFSTRGTLEETTPESWHHDINGNLNGAYNCTAAVLADLKAHGRGAIVNIGSVNGLSSLGDPAYSAAKAALISYTKALAMEYGRFGIRANMVAPGTVRTPIWEKRIKTDTFETLFKWYPLGRVAEPIDIAKAVAFLAADDAAAISGVVLPVDCGLSAGNIVLARELIVNK